jgi:hypothetical protein
MKDKPKPYYKNVAGDFYVEDGCCITCGVPEVYAPDLMGFDESNTHCFVAKQPSNEDEIYQAIKATWAAEVECIRYGGSDTEILRRLAEAGLSDSCDEQQKIQKIKPLLRNHVTFECAEIKSVKELARQLKNYILAQNNEYIQHKVSNIKTDNLGFTFSFSWYEDKFYPIWFNKIEPTNTWYIFHSLEYEEIGSRAISLQIDDWIRSNKNITNIKWLTNKAFREWQSTPF